MAVVHFSGVNTGGEQSVTDSKSETMPPHKPPSRRRRRGRPAWIGGTLVIALLAFAVLFAFTDINELADILANANLPLLALPLLCVIASYVTMALSYHGIARAAGGQISFMDMLKITLVANSLNYILATGGLSGFAARMYYFTRRSIPAESAVVISLAQTFLTNMTLLLFVLLGFVYVFVARDLDATATVGAAAIMVGLVAVAGAGATVLLHRGMRRCCLLYTAELTHRTFRRLRPAAGITRISLQRYLATLDRGISFLVANKKAMRWPLFFISLDWLLTILILHTSFLTIRYALPFAQTVVGFSVGIVVSFVSLIPGGLGIMEGSMSAVFAGMGVPFEEAVAAVLLFRVTYYIRPLLVSLVFLRDMLAQGRSAS